MAVNVYMLTLRSLFVAREGPHRASWERCAETADADD